MTPEQQTADLRAVQEFEAVEAAFARGAHPETYRVQVNRVLENAAKLPPARCKHWLSELERVGEVIPKPAAAEAVVKVDKPAGAAAKP
jgi:hypothetical protein